MQVEIAIGGTVLYITICFLIPLSFYFSLFFIVRYSRMIYLHGKKTKNKSSLISRFLTPVSYFYKLFLNDLYQVRTDQELENYKIKLKQTYRVMSVTLLGIMLVIILVPTTSSKIISLALVSNFTPENIYSNENFVFPLAFTLFLFQAWFSTYFILKSQFISLFVIETEDELITIRKLFFCGCCERKDVPMNGHGGSNGDDLGNGREGDVVSPLTSESENVQDTNVNGDGNDEEKGIMNAWVALSGGGIRAASISLGALERLNELENLGKEGSDGDIKKIKVKGISAVSGGGYAGSSFLLWKKQKKELDQRLLDIKKFCEDLKRLMSDDEMSKSNGGKESKIRDLYRKNKKNMDITLGMMIEYNEAVSAGLQRKEKDIDILNSSSNPFISKLKTAYQQEKSNFEKLHSDFIHPLAIIVSELNLYLEHLSFGASKENIIQSLNKMIEFISNKGETNLLWYIHYFEQFKNHAGFLIHWNAGVGCSLLNLLASFWISFLDTVWALVFLFVLPFVLSLLAISPVLIVMSDLYEQMLFSWAAADTDNEALPLILRFCLNEVYEEMNKNGTIPWDTWVINVRTCQFGSTLSTDAGCSLIQFSDPMPSVFIFTMLGCLVVYFFAFLHFFRYICCSNVRCNCCSSGPNTSNIPVCIISCQSNYKKGGVIHTTIVLCLSILGYVIAVNGNNHKCGEIESLIRIFLFAIVLLNVWIPLFSYERYGGVLVLFSCSSLILTIRIQTGLVELPVGNAIAYDFGERNEIWDYALIYAGIFFALSPFLNYARFHVFSHYYRHRVSMSYYPKSEGDMNFQDAYRGFGQMYCADGVLNISFYNICCCIIEPFQTLKRFVGSIFCCLRIPYNLNGGWFYMNESEIKNIVGKDQEYISQISVHNVSNKYDDPDQFMTDSTISKDILIASSKKGYDILRSGYDDKIHFSGARDTIASTMGSFVRYLLSLIGCNDVKDLNKEPLVATVTAISGGAFSPNFGDQMPNAPTSLIAFLGGFCGRWIRIKRKQGPYRFISLITAFLFVVVACCLLVLGNTMMSVCSIDGPGYDKTQCQDARISSITLESVLVLFGISLMIFMILFPDFLQEYGMVSNPFLMSLASLLSIPYTWDTVSSIFASDGGHYENLGIIPILTKEEVKDNDVIFLIDSSEEEPIPRNQFVVPKSDTLITPVDSKNIFQKKLTPLSGSSSKEANADSERVETIGFGIDPEEGFCESYCKKNCSTFAQCCCVSRYDNYTIVRTKETFYERPRMLLKALQYVQNYEKSKYDFTFSANVDDVRAFLGDDSFGTLSADELALLQCTNEFKSNDDFSFRKRCLEIKVTRRRIDGKVDGDKKSVKTFTMYHIRARNYDEGETELNPNMLGGNLTSSGKCLFGLINIPNISVIFLRCQQITSGLIIVASLVLFFTVVIHMMEWFVFGESISGQLNETAGVISRDTFNSDPTSLWKYQLSAFYGITLTLGMFAIGQRKLAWIPPLVFLCAILPVDVTEFWLIFATLTTVMIMIYFCTGSLFGKFPNHKTVQMQPFGNMHIFQAYAKQGYLGMNDAWNSYVGLAKSEGEANNNPSTSFAINEQAGNPLSVSAPAPQEAI